VIVTIDDDFDLDAIADSGQCFRWERVGAGAYRVLHGARCLRIRALARNAFELDCGAAEYGAVWRDYFDLDEDYRRIRMRIDPAVDPFLFAAAEQQKGIRILRQDPWEALVCFLISQNKNIPAIRRSVALLAETCGMRLEDRSGAAYYAFPGPAEVAAMDAEALRRCGLGYRCAYVHAAAVAVLAGKIDLERLKNADEETTVAALTGLYGVGAKVAGCVSLFGLHHTDAFPRDVWIRRVLAQEYPEGYPFDRYTPYNGVCQQYMFAYSRAQATKAPQRRDPRRKPHAAAPSDETVPGGARVPAIRSESILSKPQV